MDKEGRARRAPALTPRNPKSLTAWANLYVSVHVVGAPLKTQEAKRRDLQAFLAWFSTEVGHDQVDGWTPAVSRAFLSAMRGRVSEVTGRVLSPTTVNRVLATVRHFGRWLHAQRPLVAGNPLEGVRGVQVDSPSWNGLTDRQIMRLRAACEQRVKVCTRADQDPLLEAAVFHVLLHTGLREFELAGLDREQYHHRGFHQVQRKGSRVTKKVPVPAEAMLWLDRYLAERRGPQRGPLFLARTGARIAPQDVRRLCHRLSAQAVAQLPAKERFRLNPHQLRHTFLKRVSDKHGVHVAQRMSGNVSIREIFRYAQPHQDEVDQVVECLFA
jgi:integrase/recombinase XerD